MSARALMRRAGAALLGAVLLAGAARADSLVLPKKLKAIGEEAFAYDVSITDVQISDGVTRIGDRAFAGCKKLDHITIPASVTEFGDDILEDCVEDVLIQTEPGSAACRYAEANQIDYQADTTYRALLVGQTYEGDFELELEGPANDVKNLANCLQRFEGTPYKIAARSNLTGSGIKAAIREVFADAGPEDVSLFFYSGHGVDDYGSDMHGALVGTDYLDRAAYVTANDLRSALDEIPGRKIVLINACFSGSMLSPEMAASYSARSEPEMTADDFVNSFMRAFGSKSRAGLAAQDYFVITAASDEEESWEANIGKNGKVLGVFSAFLVEGCGYDFKKEKSGSKRADANGDGDISIEEAYRYVYEKANARVEGFGFGASQHAQVYPSNCDWFGFLRK